MCGFYSKFSCLGLQKGFNIVYIMQEVEVAVKLVSCSSGRNNQAVDSVIRKQVKVCSA